MFEAVTYTIGVILVILLIIGLGTNNKWLKGIPLALLGIFIMLCLLANGISLWQQALL